VKLGLIMTLVLKLAMHCPHMHINDWVCWFDSCPLLLQVGRSLCCLKRSLILLSSSEYGIIPCCLQAPGLRL